MTENKKRSKTIRFLLMICIYNFITALIVFSVIEISIYFHFEFETWHWTRWWLFIAILLMIEGFFAYLTPFFIDGLEEIMNRATLWISVKYSEDITKLEKKLNEMKEDARKDGLEF